MKDDELGQQLWYLIPFKEFAHADKLTVILTKNLKIFVIFFFINKKDVKVGVLYIYIYIHVIVIQMNTDALLCRSDSESIVCRH